MHNVGLLHDGSYEQQETDYEMGNLVPLPPVIVEGQPIVAADADHRRDGRERREALRQFFL